jgi:hypothetical protein
MTEREKIAARIRALLAKTVENGCTEDEAVSAAAKAAELLARYNLTVDEVEMRASPFARESSRHEDIVGERLWKPASAISELSGAVYWISKTGVSPVDIDFFGFQHEVQIAHYLLAICARAMRQQAARLERQFALLTATARRRRVVPFLDGMADRLRERIKALVPPAPTGTGLIVLRKELIDAEMKRLDLKMVPRSTRASRNQDEDYRHGRQAADRIALSDAVESERAADCRLLLA